MKKSQLRQIIKEEISKVLKENKQPTLVDIWYAVPGGGVYKVVITFDDGSEEKFREIEDAEAKYDLTNVERTESEFDVS